MSLMRSSILSYTLSIIAIVVLTILLSVTLFRLHEIKRTMRNNVNANMTWVMYQTHIKSLLLANAIQHRLLNQASSHDLSHRYQMFLSRVSMLEDGPQKRSLQRIGMADMIATQTEAVLHLGNKLDTIEATTRDYESMLTALDTLNNLLLKASNKSTLEQWDEAGAQIDAYRNGVLTILVLMIGIWIASAIISIQLLLALKKNKSNQRKQQREIDLLKQLENERQLSELYRSFGSMVSHQFRTPLTIIDATMQRLIRAGDRMDADEVQLRAAKAWEATKRLTYLIEKILQADRFVTQAEVTMKQCCLAHLAQLAINEQHPLSPTRKIQLLNQTHGVSTVICDPVLTLQIIDNLLSNALKFSDEHMTVYVRIYQDNGWVCCAVRDNGKGISADDMPHIFTRYFRANTATDVDGTGIGLYIAAELTTLQQGKLSAHSEPGEGSTFVLCLPKLNDATNIISRKRHDLTSDKGE
ncbi:MAG: HAMP domain-containing histidine kinase [Alcaligenaceae bacterium]|nr:HAMP domain-containing histidine kinase [Alcaligenaceae bacterium]